jgi:hypothetical protein
MGTLKDNNCPSKLEPQKLYRGWCWAKRDNDEACMVCKCHLWCPVTDTNFISRQPDYISGYDNCGIVFDRKEMHLGILDGKIKSFSDK